MDKYEYRVRSEEIKELIARKEYAQAAEIADTIDWRRVKSVMMLCTISDLYKMNRRYEDSRDLLLLAYDRHPGGRTIVYSLCELSIKMGEIPQALEYCKEYIQIAPKDPGRYILQYKLYEAQEVSLEERIAVLEELKKRDYREKWAYELAYLYHRVGLASKCVDECDEMIVWFGEGKYVIKAMELKMLHQSLTPEQQRIYDKRFEPEAEEAEAAPVSGAEENVQEPGAEKQEPPIQEVPAETIARSGEEPVSAEGAEEIEKAETKRVPAEEIDIQVKTMDPGQCNTINLQEEVAAGLRELLEGVQEDAPEAAKTVVEEVQTDEVSVPEMTVTEEAKQSVEAPAEPPKEMAKVLSMEADGQISFVVPEKEAIEKQITGQLCIADIMAEWERMKKELEEKGKEKVRQHVKENTDQMFTDFEASMRDDLLKQLENGRDVDSVIAEAEGRSEETVIEETFVKDIVEGLEDIFDEGEQPEEEAVAAVVTAPIVEEAVAVIAEEVSESAEEVQQETIIEEETASAEEVQPEAITEEEPMFTEDTAAEPIVEEAEPELVEEVEPNPLTEDVEDIFAEVDTELVIENLPEEVITTEDEVEELEEIAEIIEEEEEKLTEQEPAKVRSLTKEEKELFGAYIQGRSSREQLIHAIDSISMAAYTGNVIITGAEGLDTLGLAKSIIREVQMTDNNFSGKIAKISGDSLNKREVKSVLEGLNNGALIIQKATGMNAKTVESLHKVLQQENRGIVVILEGTKKAMNAFLEKNDQLQASFTARIDMEALSDATLVAFGKKYAREQECSIDEFGVLALHQIITDRQTSDHAVTIMEVKEIMDEAIYHANRKTVGHFFEILMGKRYDDEDMIIIREKDFIN